MISIIIPTMWFHKPFLKFLKKLVKIKSVGEIIIINNNVEQTPNDTIFEHHKIRSHSSKQNLFVAPSWNLGANLAKYDNIAFLSDDLEVDIKVFNKVNKFMNDDINDEIGMICILCKYLDDLNYEKQYTDGKIDILYVNDEDISKRPTGVGVGMGNLFFIKKKNWKEIPGIKIFHGEIMQWNRLETFKKNYVIVNCFAETPWHATWKVLADDTNFAEQFSKIQLEDQKFAQSMNFRFN